MCSCLFQAKMSKLKKTRFNERWILERRFSLRLKPVEKDSYAAYCMFCKNTFALSIWGKELSLAILRVRNIRWQFRVALEFYHKINFFQRLSHTQLSFTEPNSH